MLAVSIIAFFGGIALFLFGITLMGDGLRQATLLRACFWALALLQ